MRKFIAGYQFIGAIVAIIVFASLIMKHEVSTTGGLGGEILLWVVEFGFVFINLAAGITLWKNKKMGYGLSFINLLLQSVFVRSKVFIMMFASPFWIDLFANINPNSSEPLSLGFDFQLGANVGVGVGTVDNTGFYMGINVFALFLLIVLFVLYKKRNRHT